LRIRWVECLLVVAATGATYLAAEAAFCRFGLRYVPLRLHAYLPDDVRVFAQSSKTAVLPLAPVLLLGDSYAQGYGDWLLEANPYRNGPFHSAHIIQALSGQDVVTLGASGAGSAEAIAAIPAIAYEEANRAWYLGLPKPRVAVVYFYEGNDLNNNMRFLERRVDQSDAAGLAERIDRSLAAYPSVLAAPASRPAEAFPLLRFSARMARRIYGERTATLAAPEDESGGAPGAGGDPPDVVEVAGRPVSLPSNLQSPSMELTMPEIERAVLVYGRSLGFLRRLLPETAVLVVYLPSPLASYRLLGTEVSIQPYVTGRATRYPRVQVAQSSNAICELIRTATIADGAGFLDLRPAVRVAGAHDMLHGPRDFKHFNRKGMEVLGQAVAARIGRPLEPEPCAPNGD